MQKSLLLVDFNGLRQNFVDLINNLMHKLLRVENDQEGDSSFLRLRGKYTNFHQIFSYFLGIDTILQNFVRIAT